MMTKTKSTYEATYYYMAGGRFESATSRLLNLTKKHKKGFASEWTITMINVPDHAIKLWDENKAIVNVRDFEAARRKLKRMVINYL